MKILKLNLLLSLAFLIQIHFAHAQINKGVLTLGKSVTADIAPNEHHRYTVSLDADQFVFFKLMQQGVDMKIATYNPADQKLEDFDSPNGKHGPELFSLTSGAKGKYVIEVSPFDENEPAGNYTLSIQSSTPKAITPSEKVDELFTAWNSMESPGASVAIVKDKAVVYKSGYGMATLEFDIPNTPSTIFHIASVSKQFTVFSILLLEKQGKLSLDDDIRKYIPEVPDFGKTITLRHLASHTSGMRDQWNLLSMAGWRFDDVITKEHVMKLVSKQKELNFDPGEEFAYCNTGFTLLAEVAARVSEQTFAEFTEANIFKPLKMSSTLFYDDHEKIVKNRAYSYYSDGAGYKKSVLSYANVGATSLFTTVEDLSLWAMNFSNPIVGDTSIINKMNTLAVLNDGETFGGALGQFVGKYKGLNEIQHGGADAGYRSYLTRFPDYDFAVSVFSNSAEFNPGSLAHKIVDIYLSDHFEVVEEVVEEVKETMEVENVSVAQEILDTYVGDYELAPGFIITIKEEDGQLFGQATGQPQSTLSPISNTEFKVVGVDAKLEFVPNGGEDVELLKLHQNSQEMEAPRLDAFDKDAVDLSEFSGAFYSEELSTTYHFNLVDKKLIASHRRLSDFNLNPIKDDVFSTDAWYFGQVEFVRDATDLIKGIKVSNGRVRNLYFEKVK